jgi:arsenate reductase
VIAIHRNFCFTVQMDDPTTTKHAASKLKVYTLSNCGSCRAATKWLRGRGIAFEELAIRETPPTDAELRSALAAQGGEVRKLFNTSGQDYREQNLAVKLPGLSVPAALKLLRGNGRLVKRPFLIGDGRALVGFNEKAWATVFAKG